MAAMDQVSEDEVLQLILEKKSYKEISEILQNRYSHIDRGLSERSIRRFVSKTDLKKRERALVDEEVKIATQEVSGTWYGEVAVSVNSYWDALPLGVANDV